MGISFTKPAKRMNSPNGQMSGKSYNTSELEPNTWWVEMFWRNLSDKTHTHTHTNGQYAILHLAGYTFARQ